jgi:hypothetical protein
MRFIKSAIFLFILGTNGYSQTTKDSITVTLSSIDSINDRLTAIENKLSEVLKKNSITRDSSKGKNNLLQKTLSENKIKIDSLKVKNTALEASNISLSKKGTDDATEIMKDKVLIAELNKEIAQYKQNNDKLNQYQLSNEQHIKYVKELLIRNLKDREELDTSYLNSMLGFFKNDTSSTKLIKDINTYLSNQNSLESIKKTMKLPEFKDFKKTKEAFDKIIIPTNFVGLTKRKIKESGNLDQIINIINNFRDFQNTQKIFAIDPYRLHMLDEQLDAFNLYEVLYTNYPCILFQFNKLQGDKSYVLPKTD